MNPRIRMTLYAVAGAALALVIGADLANESYALAIVVALLAAWLVMKKISPAAPQAWMVAFLLVGYIVGNRGFAQAQPTRGLPLLPAEAVLLVAVPVLVVRAVMGRSPGVMRDGLNLSILVWMTIGTLRLPLDMRAYGVTALRDFAMVYYAAFFFIAQDFGADSSSTKVAKGALSWAFVLLIPAVVSILLAPNFLLTSFTWHDIPLIYHKSDLIAMSLAAGFFWLWTRWEKTRRRWWLCASLASLLLIATEGSPRSGMVAVFLITILWLLTGRWRILAYQLGVGAAGAVLAIAVVLVSGRDLKTSIPYSMYEHAASLFDPAGNGTYINGDSGDLGGNNQFRLIWWRDVIEDTLTTAPFFGQGFGADLSTRFLADFDLLGDETFAARSPHSMIVTVIGRMGLVGVTAWGFISAYLWVLVWRLIKGGDPDGMGLAAVVAAVWISSCVGVVLEGPMGAVLFWTALGLARAFHRQQQTASVRPGAADAREWPVAIPVPSDTQSLPR